MQSNKIAIGRLKNADASVAARFFKGALKTLPYYSPETRDDIALYSSKNLRKDLKDRNLILLVVKDDKKIIGFISASSHKATGWIDYVLVDPNYRHRGIASSLIRNTERAMKRSTHKIWVDTSPDNLKAIKLFRKLGYKEIARLGRYHNQDKIIWEKSL